MILARARRFADLPPRPTVPRSPSSPQPGDPVQTASGPARVAGNGIDRVALSKLRRIDLEAATPDDPPSTLGAPPHSGQGDAQPPAAPRARGADALALAIAAATQPAPGRNPVTVHQNQGAPGLSELLNSVLA